MAHSDDRITVLLVDDEPMILRLLHRIIEAREGIQIVGDARDGQEALELWKRLRPDVIVLDQMMPDMHGLEVAEQILSEEPTQRIVLFTAVAEGSIDDAAVRLGIEACLTKTKVSHIVELIKSGPQPESVAASADIALLP